MKHTIKKIFPLSTPSNAKMLIVIFISDQTLLKLKLGIDECLCLLCAWKRNINALCTHFWRHLFQDCIHGISNRLISIAKNENNIFSFCETYNELTCAFGLSKIEIH